VSESTELQIRERSALLLAPDSLPLTTRQAALATGYAEATLRRWACRPEEGALTPSLKKPRRNLYLVGDIRRWLGLETETENMAAATP